MKNRDYPLAPTYFNGGDPPSKKKKASSTPAYKKTTTSELTPEQAALVSRANKKTSALHQAKSQTADPSILAKYERDARLSQDSVIEMSRSRKNIVKIPAKKTGK